MVAFSIICFLLLFSLFICQSKNRNLRNILQQKDDEVAEQNQLIGSLNGIIDKKTDDLKMSKKKINEIQRKLSLLENIDHLTGTGNRSFLDQEMKSEWKRAHRSEQSLALVLADLDYFKIYSDSYSGESADACVKQVAEIIKEIVRRSGDLVARFNEDTFAILLPDTDADGAFRVAEKIRKKIESLGIAHLYSPSDPFITMSFGYLAIKPTTVYEADNFIPRVEKALKRAKESGRNCVVDYYKTWPESKD